MATFLSTLRNNLRPEHRLFRILLGGIGEIFMVMVGILLALQVNNWNEGRKASAREVGLVNSLIRDLQTKQQENITDRAYGDTAVAISTRALDALRMGGEVDTADVKKVIGYMASDTWFYNSSSPTFRSISGSELWQRLPDSLAMGIEYIYDRVFSRIELTYAKTAEYGTDCRLNYLVPNQLLDAQLAPQELNQRIAASRDAFQGRLALFLAGGRRLNNSFDRSSAAIAKQLPALIAYRDSLQEALR